MSTASHATEHPPASGAASDVAAGPAAPAPEPAGPLTVLVYSDDPKTREQVLLAIGRHPVSDLPSIRYDEYDDSEAVVATVDEGGVDLAILDGEAAPTGGMGLCRQLKNEVRRCPPILLLTGRRDDRWLATWSLADTTLVRPLDPVTAAETVAQMLRDRSRGVPVVR
jgi:DNA-binding response OmpR family regulator